jgi:hypothetical protein
VGVAVSQERIKRLVTVKVGREALGGPAPDQATRELTEALAAEFDSWWELHGDKPGWALRALYVQLELIESARGQLSKKGDVWLGGRGGIRLMLSQRVKVLEKLEADTLRRIEAEWKRLEAQRKLALGGALPATGPILARPGRPGTATVTTTTVGGARVSTVVYSGGVPDPADPRWGGCPASCDVNGGW